MSRPIVLVCWGSYGDLFPYLAVASRLRERGHQPVVATAPYYRDLVGATGLAARRAMRSKRRWDDWALFEWV